MTSPNQLRTMLKHLLAETLNNIVEVEINDDGVSFHGCYETDVESVEVSNLSSFVEFIAKKCEGEDYGKTYISIFGGDNVQLTQLANGGGRWLMIHINKNRDSVKDDAKHFIKKI